MMSMPSLYFLEYLKAIDILEAREMLNQLKVSEFPQTKQQHKQRTIKALQKIAFPRSWSKQKAVTTREAFAMLTGRGGKRGDK